MLGNTWISTNVGIYLISESVSTSTKKKFVHYCHCNVRNNPLCRFCHIIFLAMFHILNKFIFSLVLYLWYYCVLIPYICGINSTWIYQINEKQKTPHCRKSSKIRQENRRKGQNGHPNIQIYDHSFPCLVQALE